MMDDAVADSNVKHEETVTSPSKADTVPTDIKELTIRNLDTGEEFVIGENDPDFEFDTFELRGDPEPTNPQLSSQTAPRRTYWQRFVTLFFSRESAQGQACGELPPEGSGNGGQQSTETFRTPFTKLSSFKFRKELGKGAFGRVLLAEARCDGKLYALKIISKKNMRSSDKRQAKAERDILHAMGHRAPHPFTAGLKFAFQSENNLYLGMDYFPGGTLRELIKRFGCLPEDWVRFYTAELVLAISHLHSLHVLYRDIKPHNVMLDSRGHIVLIDFGLSKQEIMHPRGAMSLVGTPDYSAPEVLRTGVFQIEQYNKQKAGGQKKKDSNTKTPANIGYGKAADWWSIGVMVYEMLAGTPAFRGTDLRETYQKVLFADLIFKPEDKFSEESRTLISGLLRREPSLRLGAWDNPPTDIMRLPFFNAIQWEDIYYRVKDGPWIPEPVSFRTQSFSVASVHGGDKLIPGSSRVRTEVASNQDNEYQGFDAVIAGSAPTPSKRITSVQKVKVGTDEKKLTGNVAAKKKAEMDIENDVLAAGKMDEDVARELENVQIDDNSEPADDQEAAANDINEGLDLTEETAAVESDDGIPEEPEIIPQRDSIFISGRNKTASNVVADWSFVDIDALAAAAQDGPTTASERPSSAVTKTPFIN